MEKTAITSDAECVFQAIRWSKFLSLGNLLDAIDGYAVVNINGTYKFNKIVYVFARVNNLFDTDYETFGLLGEADEIFDGSGATAAFTSPVFQGPGAPISGFIGISIPL